MVLNKVSEYGVRGVISEHWEKGSDGAVPLAKAVIEESEKESNFKLVSGLDCCHLELFRFLYDLDKPIKEKIATIAREIYGADGVEYSERADKQISLYTNQGFGGLPICMAKTQLSLSHDPNKKGAPTGFTLPIREVSISVGAGFIFPMCGDIMTVSLNLSSRCLCV